MKRQVYFENWQPQLVAMIGDIPDLAYRVSDAERYALLLDLSQLKEMARQVREVPAEEREAANSAVLAWTVKEAVDLPESFVAKLGDLFDIYRRFRTKLTWDDAN